MAANSTGTGTGSDDGLTMDQFITICVFVMIAIQVVVALITSAGLQALLWAYRKCSIPHSSNEVINLNPREYQQPLISNDNEPHF